MLLTYLHLALWHFVDLTLYFFALLHFLGGNKWDMYEYMSCWAEMGSKYGWMSSWGSSNKHLCRLFFLGGNQLGSFLLEIFGPFSPGYPFL